MPEQTAADPATIERACTAWLAQQEQRSPCQEVAFAAGWQAASQAGARRIEDALRHYRMGRGTAILAGSSLFVDWHFVATQMAAALRGGTEDSP